MKKLECRNAGKDATWPDSFLLAESYELKNSFSICKAAPSLPRLCGKDGDLTYVDWRGLKKADRWEEDRELQTGMSLMCVAMYHLLPKLSCTAALRSP